MENKFCIEFPLEQQTPLIHFQHGQQGATLRASEVKPKLDRFLIKEYGGFEKLWKDNASWFAGTNGGTKKEDVEKKPALAYKLSFFSKSAKIDEPPKNGLYYGNMGKKDESEKAKYVSGECNMRIFSFRAELLDYIKDRLEKFFVVTNFGRMQGKGFGSYLIKGTDSSRDTVCGYLADSYGAPCVYYFSVGGANSGSGQDDSCMSSIKKLYSVMKSGYNINGVYRKSFLFEYFLENDWGNEKAYLKKKKISPWKDGRPYFGHYDKDYSESFERDDSEYKYVRALFGTGDHIDYLTGEYNERNKPKKQTVTIKNTEIERYPSPILFKVIGKTVYMVARRVNETIFEKEFTFDNGRDSVKIKTPGKCDFDIDDFMDFFYCNYNKCCRDRGYGIGTSLCKWTEAK